MSSGSGESSNYSSCLSDITDQLMYIKSANYGCNIVTSFVNPFVLGWVIGICSLKSSYYTNYDKYFGQMYSVVHNIHHLARK
jgi:hypothetical protein